MHIVFGWKWQIGSVSGQGSGGWCLRAEYNKSSSVRLPWAACPLVWPAHLHGGPFYYCGGEWWHIVAWLGCHPWTKQGQSGMSWSGSLPAAGFRVRELNHANWLTHVSTRCVVVVDGSASVGPVVLLAFNLLADLLSRNGIFFSRNGEKKDLFGWTCKYKSQHAVIPLRVCLIIRLNLITFEAKFFCCEKT